MAWFQLIFPLVMLLFPLVFVLASGVSTEALPTAKPLMRGLWACTLGTLAIHLALWFAGIGAATYMGFAFMPLWFFLAMPALVHRRPEWQRLHGSTPQRSASPAKAAVHLPSSPPAWSIPAVRPIRSSSKSSRAAATWS